MSMILPSAPTAQKKAGEVAMSRAWKPPFRRQVAHHTEMVGDVAVGADPLDDGARGVAQRHGARRYPAVPVAPLVQPVFGLKRFAALDGKLPGGTRTLAIVGVEGVEPAFSGELFKTLSSEGGPVVDR